MSSVAKVWRRLRQPRSGTWYRGELHVGGLPWDDDVHRLVKWALSSRKGGVGLSAKEVIFDPAEAIDHGPIPGSGLQPIPWGQLRTTPFRIFWNDPQWYDARPDFRAFLHGRACDEYFDFFVAADRLGDVISLTEAMGVYNRFFRPKAVQELNIDGLRDDIESALQAAAGAPDASGKLPNPFVEAYLAARAAVGSSAGENLGLYPMFVNQKMAEFEGTAGVAEAI
jgi:hypothetical protein